MTAGIVLSAVEAGGDVGDPSATRTVYVTVVLLTLLGVVLVGLAIWVFRRTRPDPALLAPLEEMDRRKWRTLDPAARRRLLDEARPPGAAPLERSASVPNVDQEFASAQPVRSFEDLADDRVTAERADDALVDESDLASSDETTPGTDGEPTPGADGEPAPGADGEPAPGADGDPAAGTVVDQALVDADGDAPVADDDATGPLNFDDGLSFDVETQPSPVDGGADDEIDTNTDDTSTDEPDTDEPDTDEPDTDEPDTDEPDTDEPDADEPADDAADDPADERARAVFPAPTAPSHHSMIEVDEPTDLAVDAESAPDPDAASGEDPGESDRGVPVVPGEGLLRRPRVAGD